MSPRTLPGATQMLSANDGSAQIVSRLDAACDDPAQDAATRALLAAARDALVAASADAETARLRYHALFDAVPDPVSIIDAQGIVLDLNRAGMVAYRRTRAEVVGQPIDVLNPDLPRDHMVPVWEALDRGDTYVIEVTNMRADGTRFPVEVHSAGFDHDGRKCLVAVARDLSRRREAEVRYRELMEVLDKGLVIQNDEGAFVYGNSAALRMFGIRPGQSLAEEMRPDRWMAVREDGSEMPWAEYPAMRAMRTGRLVESTLLGMYHQGRRQLTWMSVTAVPQFAAGADRPHQVLSLFSDVTKLKRDSALFDRVQSLAHIGGWEWDCTADALYLTDEAVQILAQDAAPASMQAMLNGLCPADRPKLRTAVDAAVRDGGSFELELQGMRADGHACWMRVIGEAKAGDAGVARVTGTLQDITDLKQGEETLRVQARTDPLTGLINRDAILAELDERLRDPVQDHVAVLYLDLDRFKMVNDVLGHAAGDQLLSAAARRIRDAVGTEGLIARFGGDEFLVVCGFDDDPDRPERIADAILASFAASFRFDSEEFAITTSIGIARAPRDGDRPQLLIQNADAAMYDSKRRMRNGRQAFTPAMAQSQRDRLRFETQLRRAVENEEFHLVYQPQVDLRNGRIVAAEALIRWRSHLGEMRPDHFIGHAETTGDIVRIGGWVLREACRQVAAWRDAGLGIVRVAVNVSYRQFLGEDLADSVRETLALHDLPGSALELEFTERVLIEDAPETLRTFARLRALGVMLSIDDFGEGYSALNYLRRLPIHGLKLSQLFVAGVPGNQSDVAVCEAVSGIARSLKLGLVAEGVESEAQRRFLLKLGVPVGQGFLFAPGLQPDEFARRILAARAPASATGDAVG